MKKHVLAAFLSTALVVASTLAATLTVTNTNDTGPGSLRDTISIATSADEIRFDTTLAGVPVVLASGQIIIDKDLTITGLGTELTIIDGAGTTFNYPTEEVHRWFEILSGVSLTLRGLTLTDGNARYADEGGGILNYGLLTVDQCILREFESYSGGGAIANRGTAHIIDTDIEGNQVQYRGAGIENLGVMYLLRSRVQGNPRGWNQIGAVYNAGTMTAVNSTFARNGARYVGGGIFNEGDLHLVDSYVSSNYTVTVGEGGSGIYNSGTLYIVGTIIAGNLSIGYSQGGGLVNEGHATIVNSTIAGNESDYGAAGIYNNGMIQVSSSTIASNRALFGRGGGLGIHNVGESRIKDSIIVGNLAVFCFDCCGDAPCLSDCYGPFISMEHNVIGVLNGVDDYGVESTVCRGFGEASVEDLIGVPLEDVLESEVMSVGGSQVSFAVLADNGGPTPTVALIPNNPAVDGIPPAACFESSVRHSGSRRRGTTCGRRLSGAFSGSGSTWSRAARPAGDRSICPRSRMPRTSVKRSPRSK